jgi:hypothetical protein
MNRKRLPCKLQTVLGCYDLDDTGKPIPKWLAPRLSGEDYGTDPYDAEHVRMVPSGDIVTLAEAAKRLAP